jgi:SAM-dependent methyltransferase
MTARATAFSYEPFSLEPEYIEVNRRLVARLPWSDGAHVLDVACGAGAMTRLAREQADVTVTAIDLARGSLDVAVATRSGGPRTRYVEASAEHLPVGDRVADVVLMGNAIHIFPDKAAVLHEFQRVLKPGGSLACNSSFFAGTFVSGTERFYTEWMKHALGHVAAVDRNRRKAGLGPVRRARGGRTAAFSNAWLSAEEYRRLLEAHGFQVVRSDLDEVTMTRRSFESVASYEGLATVLLDGYPVDVACEALVAGVRPALESVQRTEIPRRWLSMVAVRR